MPTINDVQALRGQTLHDNEGGKIGEIVDIYLDRRSGEPEWLAVRTGLFGSNVSFVPLREAAGSGDDVRVPYDKALVKDSPNVEADGELSPDEERRLYEHYSLDFGDFDYDRDDADDRGPVGHDTSGPTTDTAMTRSEEELVVGKARRETGRARLRKYVVTENVETTVPVRREVARLEREPVTDANVDAATDGPAISEEEHEVVLHEEQAVVDKQAVPKERVRLDKETTVDEQQVSDTIRKEQIDVDEGRGTP
jgi:uncharacterized protein (TIGR02271 family)